MTDSGTKRGWTTRDDGAKKARILDVQSKARMLIGAIIYGEQSRSAKIGESAPQREGSLLTSSTTGTPSGMVANANTSTAL